MESLSNVNIFLGNKKLYKPPQILQELLLETRAGSIIPPNFQPPSGGGQGVPSGDFPINNEP